MQSVVVYAQAAVATDAGTAGETTLGISLGIPAAIGVAGTFSSGSLISVSGHMLSALGTPDGGASVVDIDGGQLNLTELGSTLAHEASHSIGRYHTTGRDADAGSLHDLISDTPECPPSADTNGNNIYEPAECEAYGARFAVPEAMRMLRAHAEKERHPAVVEKLRAVVRETR